MMTNIRSYSELITIPTFEGRFEYLKLDGVVGKETFGFDRYLNQKFYTSYEYRKFRRDMVIRDLGCDMGVEGYPLCDTFILHHINAISPDDIINRNIRILLDPENVICVNHRTHNAIHYGDRSLLITGPIERSRNDTCPWKR